MMTSYLGLGGGRGVAAVEAVLCFVSVTALALVVRVQPVTALVTALLVAGGTLHRVLTLGVGRGIKELAVL